MQQCIFRMKDKITVVTALLYAALKEIVYIASYQGTWKPSKPKPALSLKLQLLSTIKRKTMEDNYSLGSMSQPSLSNLRSSALTRTSLRVSLQ